MVKNSSQKLRFGAVGIINTLLDFAILFALKFAGVPIVLANIISTGTAFSFSFLANKNYTFKAKGKENLRREIILFIAVTLFGLWVIQTIVIQVSLWLTQSIEIDPYLKLLGVKLIATAFSLVWNYVLYDRVVFKR